MITPTLSILICALHQRLGLRRRLLSVLNPQLNPRVEMLMEIDGGEMSIGLKRNQLLDKATGDYVCFVDDDDLVADDYVESILDAIDNDHPDCVGFMLKYTQDGQHFGDAIHSLVFTEYGDRKLASGLIEYFRTPNHLNPVRRELALQVKFPEKDWGEDHDYSKRLRPLLKTETFINRTMYHYLYKTKK